MIAICDHNSAKNTAAVQEAGRGTVAVIAGIEITTREEVHVLGLFPDAESACHVGETVAATLPPATDEAIERFGTQPLLDASGRCVGTEPQMLAAASGLALPDAVDLIRSYGGLVIAAHVDRPSFSVFSQLGMFPEDARFDAVEVSAVGYAHKRHHELASLGLPILASSDSHFLSEIGACRTLFDVLDAGFGEIAQAFGERSGRRCLLA